MGYITIRTDVDVDINYDEFTDSDIVEIIDYRLDYYKRRKKNNEYKELVNDIENLLRSNIPSSTTTHDDEGTLAYELKFKACQQLMKKCSLEQLEEFLYGK